MRKKIISLFLVFSFVFNGVVVVHQEAKAILPIIIGIGGRMLISRIMAMSAVRYAGHAAASVAGSTAFQAGAARYLISKAAYNAARGVAVPGTAAAMSSLLKNAVALGVGSYVLNKIDEWLEPEPDAPWGSMPQSAELQYRVDENGRISLLARRKPAPVGSSVKALPVPVFNPVGNQIASNFTKEDVAIPPLYSNAFVTSSYTQCLTMFGNGCATVSNMPSTFKYVSPIIRTYSPPGYVNPELTGGYVADVNAYADLFVGCVDPADCASELSKLAAAHTTANYPVKNLSIVLSPMGADPEQERANAGILHGEMYLKFDRCATLCTMTQDGYSSCPTTSAANGQPHPFCLIQSVDTTPTPFHYYVYPVKTQFQYHDSAQSLFDSFPDLKTSATNHEFLAELTDKMWKDAAADAAFPLPYDSRYPVTKEDVASALGGETYTIEQLISDDPDVVNPQNCPPPAAVVDGMCYLEPDKPELGANPNTPLPTQEDTPTVRQILDPIFNLFPTLKNYSVPAHGAVCPAIEIPFFDKVLSTNNHCQLIERERSNLAAVFLFIWTLAAALVVLRS